MEFAILLREPVLVLLGFKEHHATAFAQVIAVVTEHAALQAVFVIPLTRVIIVYPEFAEHVKTAEHVLRTISFAHVQMVLSGTPVNPEYA